MKKRFLTVCALCAFFTGGFVFAQDEAPAAASPASPKMEIKFQPYMEIWWLPVAGDSSAGNTKENYRALNFYQAGLKVTGTYDKAQVYVELRGQPSGGIYNENDVNAFVADNWNWKSLYYAWGKYNFISSGNLWIGKFKPLFGPMLIDQGVMGAGWEQKFGNSLKVSGFLLQPQFFNGKGEFKQGPKKGNDWEGIGAMVTADYMGKTLMLNGGVYYGYLQEENAQFILEGFASYTGINKFTFTGEAVFGYSKVPGEGAAGLGIYADAMYTFDEKKVFSAGLNVKWATPEFGADTVTPVDYDYRDYDMTNDDKTKRTYPQTVKGITAAMDVSVYCYFKPHKSFWIQPSVTAKMVNWANGVDGKDGVVWDAKLLFRFEPSFTLKS